VLRTLKNNTLATKLYSFMRTHRPNDYPEDSVIPRGRC
jgi:hypothetical protein